MANNPLDFPMILEVVKPSTESVANSTTLQDDDHLKLELEANTNYEIDYMVYVKSASSTPNMKFQWIEPDGTFRNVFLTSAVTSVQIADEATAAATFNLDANVVEFMKGTIIAETGGSGGTFKLQWAQDTSNATAVIVQIGSYMRARVK